MAGSRPDPTPKTTTSESFTPRFAALPPIMSPTLEAANGVPFLAPLKPKLPALDQKSVLPALSPKSTFVLLKVASMCRTPDTTFFFLSRSHCLSHIPSYSSGICFCPLSTHRQPFHMPDPSVTFNIFEPLDIGCNFSF